MPEYLEIHVISCTRQPVNAPEKLADNIWFHSLHVPKIGWMRTGYIGCINAVRRKLRHIQPDLVHGQGTELESGICAAYSGFPNVITLLGIMKEMAKTLNSRPGSFHWCASILETIALRRTNGVFCNSTYTEQKVRGRTRRTRLIPNAVRSEFFKTPLPPTRPSKCKLLNVGTICSYKRQNELLDVLDELYAEGLRFEMRFIGGASSSDHYSAKFLHRIASRPYVSYVKSQSVSELIQTYDESSALIHVSAIETFGLVVAEALSRNLKLFGFNLGGVTDIARDIEGAEMQTPGNWCDLKAALGVWIRMGHPGNSSPRRTMKERYSPLEIAEQHCRIYGKWLAAS
jgi:glycosyltransferase involved in cell wall biosynthesis